jgi:YD repeat-containing protein
MPRCHLEAGQHWPPDNREFLITEQHPEKGVSGNGTVSYFGYDARGHATRLVDGASDLTFTYDGAERLTQVKPIFNTTKS